MITKNTKYLLKREATYYYSRRIPKDVSGQYSTRRIVVSLRTKSKQAALLSSSHLSLELDSYWSLIRIKKIAKSYIKYKDNSSIDDGSGVSLSDALEYYLKLKGVNKTKLFHQATKRSVRYVIDCLSDRDLSNYSTADAGKFRDYLFDKNLVSSSVKRVFSSIKSIVNLAIKEQGLDINNPFNGVYMPDLNDVKDRKPIHIDTIRTIQKSCKELDDDLRWAIALISDTGIRLAEAIGLMRSDIFIDSNTPHIVIKNNSKRRLKTKQSERIVPLAGVSLWAAHRLIKKTESEFVFERYNKGSISNANSASAAFNKWIKSVSGQNVVIHSFRHSMRDRLRAVECPAEVIDSIGGWSKKSVGETYGSGYPLVVLQKWVKKAV